MKLTNLEKLIITLEDVDKGIVEAPEGFVELGIDNLAVICNGCGAKGKLKVPDKMWRLSIFQACQIHDYEYFFGETDEDRERADDNFLTNLNNIIEHYSKNRFMRMARRRRALKYYEAVYAAGHDAFWAGKE